MSKGRLKLEYEIELEAIETYRKRLSNYAEVRTLPLKARMKVKDSSPSKKEALELLGEFSDPRRSL